MKNQTLDEGRLASFDGDFSEDILCLEEFGVAFGEKVILASLDLNISPRSMNVLIGPAGSGKSTLLRTLVGANNAQPSLKTWGMVYVEGKPIDIYIPPAPCAPQLALVMQDAHFLTSKVRENLVACLPNRSQMQPFEQTETIKALLTHWGLNYIIENLQQDVIEFSLGIQRQLAIIRAMANQPAVLLVDEATANLSESEAKDVLILLKKCQAEAAIVFVTHNQSHAKTLGGITTLMAGGRVLEQQETTLFFTNPQSAEAQCYVRTGSCQVPSPDAQPEELADHIAPPPPLSKAAQVAVRSRYEGPRGFFWLKAGQLGGAPRPGIVRECADDLQSLKRMGVSILVTLEERKTVPEAELLAENIKSIFFPIDDMGAPKLGDCYDLCCKIKKLEDSGEIIVFHCRAGLGRTGTILTAMLIFDGIPALEAIDRAREINPKWIQSQEQVDFLSQFEIAQQAKRGAT